MKKSQWKCFKWWGLGHLRNLIHSMQIDFCMLKKINFFRASFGSATTHKSFFTFWNLSLQKNDPRKIYKNDELSERSKRGRRADPQWHTDWQFTWRLSLDARKYIWILKYTFNMCITICVVEIRLKVEQPYKMSLSSRRKLYSQVNIKQ